MLKLVPSHTLSGPLAKVKIFFIIISKCSASKSVGDLFNPLKYSRLAYWIKHHPPGKPLTILFDPNVQVPVREKVNFYLYLRFDLNDICQFKI